MTRAGLTTDRGREEDGDGDREAPGGGWSFSTKVQTTSLFICTFLPPLCPLLVNIVVINS